MTLKDKPCNDRLFQCKFVLKLNSLTWISKVRPSVILRSTLCPSWWLLLGASKPDALTCPLCGKLLTSCFFFQGIYHFCLTPSESFNPPTHAAHTTLTVETGSSVLHTDVSVVMTQPKAEVIDDTVIANQNPSACEEQSD